MLALVLNRSQGKPVYIRPHISIEPNKHTSVLVRYHCLIPHALNKSRKFSKSSEVSELLNLHLILGQTLQANGHIIKDTRP